MDNTCSFDKLPVNYLQKLSALRFFMSRYKKAELQGVRDILAEMNKKYLELSMILIGQSGIQEYSPIIENLRKQVDAGFIKVLDLTPELRAEMLADQKQDRVHTYLAKTAAQDLSEGRVSGLFSQSKKIIAIDLLRPVSENIVTLSHEIVHASDPTIKQIKDRAIELGNRVKYKLKSRISSTQYQTDAAVDAMMKDVFLEMGRADLLEVISESKFVKAIVAKVLPPQPVASGPGKPPEEPPEVKMRRELMNDPDIKEWMMCVLQSTIENEYRAYVLSLSVYHSLKQNILLFRHRLNAKNSLKPCSNMISLFYDRSSQA